MRRACVAAAALMLATCSSALVSHPASAAVGLCRTDPHIQLTGGRNVDLSVSIGDVSSDVQQIQYTVHVPAGSDVKKVVYTGSDLSGRESITVVADNPADTYDTDTVVTTSDSAAVTADTKVTGVGSGSASGTSGQDLSVHVSG
jgi:hypothetical protein